MHKADSIGGVWVEQKEYLLGVFGGHEVPVANGKREFLVGLEVSELVGIGVGGPAGFGIAIVYYYVGDLANGAVGVGIQIGWIEIGPNLIAG